MIKKLQVPLILAVVLVVLAGILLALSVVIVYRFTSAGTGDINCDGEISILDYTLLRMDTQGVKQMSIDEHRRADINGDGYADEKDLLLIQEKILQGP
ncbi:MAG: dockerin type I repeat-containing protein [Burkholderiales bacterium]